MDFIFDPSLVLYLPLYELDGASFMSKDAYGHLCTVTGATWTPRGRSFDGTDDHIALPQAAYQVAGDGDDLTILIWYEQLPVSVGTIFMLSGATLYRPYFLVQILNNDILTRIRQTADITQNQVQTTPPKGLNLIGLVHDAADNNRVTQFINGEETGSDNTNSLTFAKSEFSEGCIGAIQVTEPNYRYPGIISEVWIYTRKLTPQRNPAQLSSY